MTDRARHPAASPVGSKVQFGLADERHPKEGKRVAWRKTERLLEMGLHLLGMADMQLCVSDGHHSLSQIPVERQGSLGLRHALGWAVGIDLDVA